MRCNQSKIIQMTFQILSIFLLFGIFAATVSARQPVR